MNRTKRRYAALSLCLIVAVCLFAGQTCAARISPLHLLDSLFPDKQARSSEKAVPNDPADGMPEDEQRERFGDRENVQDRAADGGMKNREATDTAPIIEEEGISVWMAVLVICLASAAVVITVIYLFPRRKNNDKK